MVARPGDLNGAYKDFVTKARSVFLTTRRANGGSKEAKKQLLPEIEALDGAYLAFRGHSLELAR